MIEKGVDSAPYSKPLLRSICEKERTSLSPQRREAAAQNLLLSLAPKLKTHGFVISFVPFRGEVETTPLNLWLAREGKLVLPRMEGEKLTFHQVEHLHFLKANRLGILEPEPKWCPLISILDVEVVLVPALAFDRDFHRLGYGGGYYDRLLKIHPHLLSIGVGFEEQLLQEKLPVDAWDFPLKSLHLV